MFELIIKGKGNGIMEKAIDMNFNRESRNCPIRSLLTAYIYILMLRSKNRSLYPGLAETNPIVRRRHQTLQN